MTSRHSKVCLILVLVPKHQGQGHHGQGLDRGQEEQADGHVEGRAVRGGLAQSNRRQ